MTTATIEQTNIGSCTFLNMTGDLTLVWDDANREKILAVIRKKMAEGYTFFTTKKFMFKRLTRKVKVSPKNIDLVEEIIITDEQFDKMISDMDDRDIATLVKNESASLVKRKGKSEITALQRAKNAEDVIDKNSVAIRPIAGG